MKIGIIGGGNMGGAIAIGLAESGVVMPNDITVSSPNCHGELDVIKKTNSGINISTDNIDAVCGTDIIIIAVKPWLLPVIVEEISAKIDFEHQGIASLIAGTSLADLSSFFADYSKKPILFRLIPNTAIAVRQSMTFISSLNGEKWEVALKNLFDALGKALIVEERMMGACTAISSCGIAYAMRYIRAASEAGVELGIYPNQAKDIVLQTLRGAVDLLESTGNHPEAEIDKVTTPGGITIKGLNAMEAHGFTNAVIEGIKASAK